MIKTYANKAAHDAATPSTLESDVFLLENINKIGVDGKNVLVTIPKKGDIVVKDEKNNYRFIAADTFNAGTFPSAWTVESVVVKRAGRIVTKAAIDTENQESYMNAWPYFVSGYVLDGTEQSIQIKLHGSEYFTFTYTANSDAEFLAALKSFLTDNGFTDWSAYVYTDGRIVLQYDNYTTLEYFNQNCTYTTGLTLTSFLEYFCGEAQPNWYRKCGNRNNIVWNAARAKANYLTDWNNTAYNPATDISAEPSYPVCFPAFCGTSQYQEDHCAWLRQKYCKDPDNPTLEDWYSYIDNITPSYPDMRCGSAPRWRDPREYCKNLAGVTYLDADGSWKPLFGAIHKAVELGDGEGFLAPVQEFAALFGEVTYRLTGIARADSDIINRNLYAVGGGAIAATYSYWGAFRGTPAGAWVLDGHGHSGSGSCYGRHRVVSLSLLELNPEDIEG